MVQQKWAGKGLWCLCKAENGQLAKVNFARVLPGRDWPLCRSPVEALNTVLVFTLVVDGSGLGEAPDVAVKEQLSALQKSEESLREQASEYLRPARAVLLCSLDDDGETLAATPPASSNAWMSLLEEYEKEHGRLWKFGPVLTSDKEGVHGALSLMLSALPGIARDSGSVAASPVGSVLSPTSFLSPTSSILRQGASGGMLPALTRPRPRALCSSAAEAIAEEAAAPDEVAVELAAVAEVAEAGEEAAAELAAVVQEEASAKAAAPGEGASAELAAVVEEEEEEDENEEEAAAPGEAAAGLAAVVEEPDVPGASAAAGAPGAGAEEPKEAVGGAPDGVALHDDLESTGASPGDGSASPASVSPASAAEHDAPESPPLPPTAAHLPPSPWPAESTEEETAQPDCIRRSVSYELPDESQAVGAAWKRLRAEARVMPDWPPIDPTLSGSVFGELEPRQDLAPARSAADDPSPTDPTPPGGAADAFMPHDFFEDSDLGSFAPSCGALDSRLDKLTASACVEVRSGERAGELALVLLVDSLRRKCKVRFCGTGEIAVLVWDQVKLRGCGRAQQKAEVQSEDTRYFQYLVCAKAAALHPMERPAEILATRSQEVHKEASTFARPEAVGTAPPTCWTSESGVSKASTSAPTLALGAFVTVVGGQHRGETGRVRTVDSGMKRYTVWLSSGAIARVSFVHAAAWDALSGAPPH